MELFVKLLFLLLLIDSVEALEGSTGLQIVVHLAADLTQVLVDVGVAIFESLFSELGDLSLHHALLVSEKAIGASEEAFEGDDLLEEAKFGVSLLLSLSFNGLLNG